MFTYYWWDDVYSDAGWILWLGMIFLLFMNLASFYYTYRAHNKITDVFLKRRPMEILNARYAKGEISREDYNLMKFDISVSEKAEQAKKAA